jgi:hypothetical protein
MDYPPSDAVDRTLHQLLRQANARAASALNVLELIGVACPTCSPSVELARTDLRAALQLMEDAVTVEARVTRLLGSPFDGSFADA